jgi:hypothetical protein
MQGKKYVSKGIVERRERAEEWIECHFHYLYLHILFEFLLGYCTCACSYKLGHPAVSQAKQEGNERVSQKWNSSAITVSQQCNINGRTV